MWPQVVFRSSEYSSIFILLDKKREIIIFQRKNMYVGKTSFRVVITVG